MFIDSIEKGFKTVIGNVLGLIWILLCIAVILAPIYIAFHFVAKYW